MKVRRIMKTDVIAAKLDMPIHEAMELMAVHHISELPVIADDSTLMGIVSEKEMLRLLYDARDNEELAVIDYTTPNVKFFGEDDSVVDVCDFLLATDARSVPILHNMRLVGMISRGDIMNFIIGMRQRNRPVHG